MIGPTRREVVCENTQKIVWKKSAVPVCLPDIVNSEEMVLQRIAQ